MYQAAPANEYFRPAIRIDEGTAEVRLTVRPDFFHAANAVHGSVYFKLLDDATFFAASSLVDGVFVLTASFNIYFLRPISAGVMTARGTVVSRTCSSMATARRSRAVLARSCRVASRSMSGWGIADRYRCVFKQQGAVQAACST